MKNRSRSATPTEERRAPKGKRVDRRTFLGQLGIGAGAAAGLTASASTLFAQPGKDPASVEGVVRIRQAQAFEVRMRAAELARKRKIVDQTPNGDEDLYPNRIGNYSKGFPHNNLGEVDPAAYNAFLAALASADPDDFEHLPMGLGRKLTWRVRTRTTSRRRRRRVSRAPRPPPTWARSTGWRSRATSTSVSGNRIP
jgi:hypothetical protein